MKKRVNELNFKRKINPFLVFFMLIFVILCYFFLGQRFDSLGVFSKILMCILVLGIMFYSYYKKGFANLFLVLNAGFWTFISLTISIGKTYVWDSPIVINLVL